MSAAQNELLYREKHRCCNSLQVNGRGRKVEKILKIQVID